MPSSVLCQVLVSTLTISSPRNLRHPGRESRKAELSRQNYEPLRSGVRVGVCDGVSDGVCDGVGDGVGVGVRESSSGIEVIVPSLEEIPGRCP